MTARRTVFGRGLAALLLAAGCSREPRTAEAPPLAPAPTAAPAPSATPTEALAVVTAVQEFPLRERPTPRPTFDVASIPNFDRPSEAPPPGPAGRLARCLSFSAESIPGPALSGLSTTRARVRARNSCSDWIAAGETLFEIESFGAARGERLGRARGSFQNAIPPHSSNAETYVGVDCPENLPGGCRYVVTGWWVSAERAD